MYVNDRKDDKPSLILKTQTKTNTKRIRKNKVTQLHGKVNMRKTNKLIKIKVKRQSH